MRRIMLRLIDSLTSSSVFSYALFLLLVYVHPPFVIHYTFRIDPQEFKFVETKPWQEGPTTQGFLLPVSKLGKARLGVRLA